MTAELLFKQAVELHRAGDLAQAERLYRQILAAEPTSFAPRHMLGVIAGQQGRNDEALALIGEALTRKPDALIALVNYANILHEVGHWDEALATHDKILALKPDHAPALSHRGFALWNLGRPAEALTSFDLALAKAPQLAGAWLHRGMALHDLKRLDEALESFDRAIALEPGNAEAHWNKALCLLLMENFAAGWREYGWHKMLPRPIEARSYAQPLWTGAQDIKGKTLFLYASQGFGDTIQFYRYASLAAARGAAVMLSAQDGLGRLLQSGDPAVIMIESGSTPLQFDYHAALIDLPQAFGVDGDYFPGATPYLKAEPDRVRKWAGKIGGHGFRIGVCWQGKDRALMGSRSFPSSCLESLTQHSGVRLISLQKAPGAAPGVEIPGEDFDAGPHAFLDTAAVMEDLDLIITADTSVAHLAGALGKRTWLALKYVPDWRWFLERSDSPWYPSLRLFRQKTDGDWQGVFAEMNAELAKIL